MIDDIDILRRVLALTATIDEGLQHMTLQFEEMRIEESMDLLETIVEGIVHVEEAMAGLIYRMPHLAPVSESAQTLKRALASLLTAYLQNNLQMCHDSLTNALLPAFRAWHDTIQALSAQVLLS